MIFAKFKSLPLTDSTSTRRRFLAHGMISTLLFQIACIHTDSTEQAHLNLDDADAKLFRSLRSNDLQIDNIVYSPGQLPLEEFFNSLYSGKFKDAFSHFDLRYKPAKTDNRVMTELLDAGFIPVFVNIKNEGLEKVTLKEQDFILSNGHHTFPALSVKELPRAFKHFSPAAASANVFNASVVVLTIVAAIGVIVLTSWKGGYQQPTPSPSFSDSDSGRSNSSGSKVDNKVFNDTTVTTRLNYHDYLLRPQELAPGESTKGLLFFKVKNAIDSNNLTLTKKD